MSTLPARRNALVFCCILFIFTVGLYIRYDNIQHWRSNPSLYFTLTDHTPVSLNDDSYYYLDIAKDLLAGKAAKFDPRRRYPEGYEKPNPLPLLSVILAGAGKISGTSLDWLAVLLPPFFGALLAFPVYLLATLIFVPPGSGKGELAVCPTIPALISALFAVLSPAFVARSSIGWYDTDILNVALLCTLTWLSLRAAAPKSRHHLMQSLSFFCLTSALFILWWDQAATTVAAFSLGYFVLAAVFGITGQRSSGWVFAPFLLALCLLIAILPGASLENMPRTLAAVFKYSISTDTAAGTFRYAGQLAAEQQDMTLAAMSRIIAGNGFVFYLAILGIALLFFRTGKYALFLLPWLILFLMSAKSNRVMIFASVLFALGIGNMFYLPRRYAKGRTGVAAVPAVLLALGLAWFPLGKAQSYSAETPQYRAFLFDRFKTLARQIPEDSVIWASWGHGHPLIYFTGARTIGDGMVHPPELVYCQYVPYAARSPRLAANWIMFYTAHGLEGFRVMNQLLAGGREAWPQGAPALQKLLGGGVAQSRKMLREEYFLSPERSEEILHYLFPEQHLPVYFLLDNVTYEEQWFKWGQAGLSQPSMQFDYTLVPIPNPSKQGNMIRGKSDLGEVSLDLAKGTGMVGGTGPIYLRTLLVDNGIAPFSRDYSTAGPWPAASLTLLLNQNRLFGYGALVDSRVLGTVFSRMLFLKDYDKTYFQSVLVDSPLIMVYAVKGDRYESGNG